jgi:hypothetical protein
MASAGFFAWRYTPKKSSVSLSLFLRSLRVSGFLVLTLAAADFQLHQICDSKISAPADTCVHYNCITSFQQKKVVPTYFSGSPFMLVCPPAKNFEIAFMSPWMCSTLCAFSSPH